MDPLFQKAKQLYPNASDEEITQSLAEIRQKLPPNTPDEEVVAAATKIQGMQQDGSWQKAMVKENVKQKYGLGEYSPEARQKLVDANASAANPIASAFAGFGAGIRGGNVSAAFDSAMAGSQAKTKAKLDAFDKDRENLSKDFAFERDLQKADREDTIRAEMQDPNSDRSKAAQAILIEDYGMSPEIATKMTAEMAEARLPGLKMKMDNQFKDRELKIREGEAARKAKESEGKGNVSPVSGKPLTEGQKKVDQDYAKHYNEFSGGGASNAKNTISQLKELQNDLIKEDKEWFGAGGGRFSSMLPDALRDRESIKFKTEIPGKANLVLKKLFGGQLSDAERESEAKTYYNDQLGTKENAELLQKKIESLEQQFESEMAKARYYEQNGTLEGFQIDVGSTEARGSADQTKTINGKTYRKVEGGWEEIQ